MANISVRIHQGKRRVTVRGRVVATDLRRLERACGSALEHRAVPLELYVREVTEMDEACQFFLVSLERRGAVVI